MRSLLLLISCVALCFNSKAQPGNQIVIGTTDSIQSKILNQNRKFYVHIPNGNAGKKVVKKRYPVVYLFDADAQFASTAGMIQYLSTNYNSVLPEMIVVGILHPDRRKDLTPTHVASDLPFIDSVSGKSTGGGEQFISFIEKELIPYIDSRYPTQPYKILIGHSFGGLAVMQTFVHHTSLFNSYICIDPSMWWDKQTLLIEAKDALEKRNFQGTSLYLGIANTAPFDMDISKVPADTTTGTKHMRNILKLQGYFENNKQNGLRYQGKYYETDSHMSVPFITEYDALHFLFNFYPLKINGKDIDDTTATSLINKCKNHYSYASKQMGYKVSPDEDLINWLGHDFLGKKQYEKAKLLFEYYLESCPESAAAHEFMGDYYQAINDTKNAIAYFVKSLTINENAGIRKKLEKIQGK